MGLCVAFENVWIPTDELNITVLREAWVAQGEPCYGYVLVTPAELQDMQARIQQLEQGGTPSSSSLLDMSVEDGILLSGAVVVLWCMAWAIRAVRKVL